MEIKHLIDSLPEAVDFKGDIEVHAILDLQDNCIDLPIYSVSYLKDSKTLLLNATNNPKQLPYTSVMLYTQLVHCKNNLDVAEVKIQYDCETYPIDVLELDGQSGQLVYTLYTSYEDWTPEKVYRERYELFNNPDVYKYYR